MDNSNFIPVLLTLLQEDLTVNEKVDGQIVAGRRGAPADPYLTGDNGTCVALSQISEQSSGTPGAHYHGRIDFISEFQIDVISKKSEAYAREVGNLCRDLFITNVETAFGGENFQLRVMRINRTPWYDQESNHYHDTLTIVGKGFYWR